MIVQYIRDENRNPFGVVVATSPNNIGYSICNPKDHFSKKEAKAVALTRAQELTVQEVIRLATDRIPFSRYEPFRFVWEKMNIRAINYFKPVRV